MGLFNKKELLRIKELEKENSQLKNTLEQTGAKELFEINHQIETSKEQLEAYKIEAEKEIDSLKNRKEKLFDSLNKLTAEINQKKTELFDLSDDLNFQEFGLYKPHYDCMTSDHYKDKIDHNRFVQKEMIKNKTALNYFDGWQLDGSKSKGRAMNNDNMKMVLKAFNFECDSIIDKVKFNNLEKIRDQIYKSASAIDKLNVRNRISIRKEYIDLKIQELELVHEYRQKKQEEKEILKEQRAQQREEAKLQKEIEEARRKVLKEQSHYMTAKIKYLKEYENADPAQKEDILAKIKEIDEHLSEIDKNIEDINYRETNQRAGYVYVISNIGSFGENVYKIGMTRRLEPQERIDELGDASVPFSFDVHAMIFSDDAPALENSLHKAFENRKVNMINGRKEFFNVALEEIKEEIKKHHEEMIDIKDVPDAEQYRETLLIKKHIKDL